MIKRIIHICLSVCLGILLIFGNTSKEFIHLFADHTDTVHSHNYNDGPVIESPHHHCTFLSFSLTPFVNDIQLPFVERIIAVHHAQQSIVKASACKYEMQVALLRGPPTV